MTDDPEITDPRDPHKRRDIVVEVDRWVALPASLREATVSHALLQAARDEIMALREIAARPSSELHALTKERDQARTQALEEAAQFIEEQQRRQRIWLPFGDAIRALKEKGDG